MRYVKISKEPGVRRDLVTGKDVYSSRFLNDEEHMLHGRVEEAWATGWCLIVSLPTYLRREWTIRWHEMNHAEVFLMVLGCGMAILIGLAIGYSF